MQKAVQASESRKVQQKLFYHGNPVVPSVLVRLKDYLSSRFGDGKAENSNRLKEVS